MSTKVFLAAIGFSLFSLAASAQVGIGTNTPESSAKLDVSSTDKGVLFPRMTEAQRTAINPAATGLLVYQTDEAAGFYYYTGSGWTNLTKGGTGGVPSGTIMAYAGSTAPSGWMLCSGAAVSRTTYAALFGAIGTTHGTGDGSTTFNLPDLRGRTVFGRDDMGGSAANRITSAVGGAGTTLGASIGAEGRVAANLPQHTHGVGTLSLSSDGAHTHTYQDAYYAENLGGGSNNLYGQAGSSDNDNSFRWRNSGNGMSNSAQDISTSSAGSHSHTISGATAANSGVTTMSVMNPGVVMNYIIKL